MKPLLVRMLAGLMISGSSAAAQAPDCGQTIQALERVVAAQRRLLNDWAGLTRYGSENTEIRPPAPGVERVVFLGDQVTELWGRGNAAFFPGKPYFNRGISRQTTSQMLVRFRQDVISLRPKAVVIQGGMNDLMGLSGPATEEMIAENFMTMSELARSHGIRVVIAAVTPVCDCFPQLTRKRSQQIMQGKIVELNDLLKEYAAKTRAVYLDYYSALVNGTDMKQDFTTDGMLPGDEGYGVMAPLAE